MLQKHTAFCAFSALAQHHQLFSPLDVIFPFKCVDLFCSSSLHYLWQFVHLLFRQTKRQTLNKYVFMTWNNVALVSSCDVTLCLLFATTRMSFILKKTRRKKKHSCSLISHILQRNNFEFSFFTEKITGFYSVAHFINLLFYHHHHHNKYEVKWFSRYCSACDAEGEFQFVIGVNVGERLRRHFELGHLWINIKCSQISVVS